LSFGKGQGAVALELGARGFEIFDEQTNRSRRTGVAFVDR
jgi:hypothetical protein